MGNDPEVRVDYGRYMASRAWALKREAVAKRAKGNCERCQDAPVHSIHHFSYAHLGNEPLTDLVAVCETCHRYLSGKQEVDPALKGLISHYLMRDEVPRKELLRLLALYTNEFGGSADKAVCAFVERLLEHLKDVWMIGNDNLPKLPEQPWEVQP